MLKRLVKQRNGRILSKNRRLEILAKKGRFPAKMGVFKSLAHFQVDFYA